VQNWETDKCQHIHKIYCPVEAEDELIIELKGVLLAREQRINELELALAWRGTGPFLDSSGQRRRPIATQPRRCGRTPRPGCAAERNRSLLAAGTTAYTPTSGPISEAVLQFSEKLLAGSCGSSSLSRNGRCSNQPVAISPNFCEPLELSLTRGEATVRDFAIPPSGLRPGDQNSGIRARATKHSRYPAALASNSRSASLATTMRKPSTVKTVCDEQRLR